MRSVINAFACNFRIDGKTNEDVEEANYLNNRIFERLSLTTVKELPVDTPLFLSSTVFAYKDYGQCVKNFQRRLGLETESDQDLFVLRNVCMSPFQTAGNFCQSIADIFQTVLEDELKVISYHVVCTGRLSDSAEYRSMLSSETLSPRTRTLLSCRVLTNST